MLGWRLGLSLGGRVDGWGSLGSQCVLACGCWGIGDRGRVTKYWIFWKYGYFLVSIIFTNQILRTKLNLFYYK